RIAAYWPGGTPPRKTSVSVPRLTPARRVRTTTSPRARSGGADRPRSPRAVTAPRFGERDRPDLAVPGRAQPERVRVHQHVVRVGFVRHRNVTPGGPGNMAPGRPRTSPTRTPACCDPSRLRRCGRQTAPTSRERGNGWAARTWRPPVP